MDDQLRVISTDEELKIFNDPYRMKIIRTFRKSPTPLTVKGCADLMGEVPAKVHYHIQKLIKINILELDHIEVINGINAKYYKLPKEAFAIALKDSDDTKGYKQMAQVHSLVSRFIDEFKEAFMMNSAMAIEEKDKKDSDVGQFTSNEISLTEEEFTALSKMLAELPRQYHKTSEDRKAYIYLAGLTRSPK